MLDLKCNDQCDFAVAAIVGLNLSDNNSAGPDDGEASCQPDSNHDVWFVYTADCDGAVFVSTTGSALTPINDAVLSIHDDCPSRGGIEIACDDDSGAGLNAALLFNTIQGETYYVRLAGFEDNKGPMVLNLRPDEDCLIDGVCYLAGDKNPENDCQSCVPQVSTAEWTSRPEGSACGSNGDTECDSPDACDGSGVCLVNYIPNGTSCDDGDICTGTDRCQAGVCVGVASLLAPTVQAISSRHLRVTPLPVGSAIPVALRITGSSGISGMHLNGLIREPAGAVRRF